MSNLVENLAEKGLSVAEIETQPNQKPQYVAKGVARLAYLPELWRPSHAGVIYGRYRDVKPYGLIIRAKWNKHRIGPEALIGHKVLWLIKTGEDKHGNTRPYLRLYARENDQETNTNLYVLQFIEKSVGSGATAAGIIENGNIEYATGPLSSGGAGTHWENHVVATCRDDIEPNAGIRRKGPTGKTWFERII